MYLEARAPEAPLARLRRGNDDGRLVGRHRVDGFAGVAGYLERFIDLPRLVVAVGLILLLAGVALIGVRESVSMNIVFTLIEAAGLVLVIAVGATVENFGAALGMLPDAGVIGGAALVFFSFLGFENIANLAEEAKNPERNLPRAILLSLLVASVLYVLVALAAVALLPLDELTRSNAPLSAAVATKSPRVAGVLGAIALFATANTAAGARGRSFWQPTPLRYRAGRRSPCRHGARPSSPKDTVGGDLAVVTSRSCSCPSERWASWPASPPSPR